MVELVLEPMQSDSRAVLTTEREDDVSRGAVAPRVNSGTFDGCPILIKAFPMYPPPPTHTGSKSHTPYVKCLKGLVEQKHGNCL